MPVIKIQKPESNFTTLHNVCLHDANMSAQAKGVYAYLMSLPSDWSIHVKELVKHFSNGRDAIYTILRELEKFGYLQRTRIRDENTGKLSGQIQYMIFDLPRYPEKPDNSKTENRYPENQELESRMTVPYIILNTNQQKAAAKTTLSTESVDNPELTKHENHVIGNELSRYQKRKVLDTAIVLHQKYPSWAQDIIERGLIATLLDVEQFQKTKNDFNRKLKAIIKSFEKGDWYPIVNQAAEQGDNQIHSLNLKINECRGELQMLENLIHHEKNDDIKLTFINDHKAVYEKIQTLKHQQQTLCKEAYYG